MAFIRECAEALERVRTNPEWVASDADGIRSLRVHRFPYLVHYRVEGSILVLFAIMFGGRDPSAWQSRIYQSDAPEPQESSLNPTLAGRGPVIVAVRAILERLGSLLDIDDHNLFGCHVS